ncbi:hypothetical protein GA0061098_106016 [Bradyrhizobium shewense]|uniref:Uncharacterized protein n=1 Tax=Bradyrhizobium shewense TaxID=1761772 RepID=A0A1C3XUJ0_9BRAD|nr:hypothetical protein GA0061098_106016 [Bradyrhizobium shewense]
MDRQQVRLKRNAQAIYQDLVDQFGFTASYESVKRFVRALRHIDPKQFDRLKFAPGEEARSIMAKPRCPVIQRAVVTAGRACS